MSKNIVLLSDGTGNGSASPFKTNVWRLYQALDIAQPPDETVPRQIAYYDNGVGSESLKPIAALGGAFGIGVWKNVRDIYTFVCRNYQLGDRIYGFGFSRGAFTIRLVMGLIGKCGIVKPDPHSEALLLNAVQAAYEAYRRDYLIRASRHRGMIYHHVLREPRYFLDEDGKRTNVVDLSSPGLGKIIQMFVDIPFLGVWDTVDAYGMPVDELKLAIDQKVWPMSFADRDPSRRLQMIRHALSLDDERPTFRPVLWNEVLKPQRGGDPEILGANTIQQVWFAGVHANVGGGYPDDGLAYATLDWMMNEAQAAQLRFEPAARLDIANRSDAHGEQYDSRAGVAGYYRYGPRQVKELCHDVDHGVEVPVVRVHAKVFDRIAANQCAYAPVSLNRDFDLIGENPRYKTMQDFLHPEGDVLQRAWDIVWWRRLAYFATLTVTAYLSLFVLRLMFTWPDGILRVTEAGLSPVFGARITG